MAILTLFCLLYPERPITLLIFFIIPVTVKPKWVFWGSLVISIGGILLYELPGHSHVAHSAHLGGMFAGKDRFVLKVNGDSMIDKAIMSGDWVVVQSQQTAQHGDIVVALVDGFDATLKTLLINNDQTMTLMPANANYDPVTLPADRVSIQGVIVGQLRTYP